MFGRDGQWAGHGALGQGHAKFVDTDDPISLRPASGGNVDVKALILIDILTHALYRVHNE